MKPSTKKPVGNKAPAAKAPTPPAAPAVEPVETSNDTPPEEVVTEEVEKVEPEKTEEKAEEISTPPAEPEVPQDPPAAAEPSPAIDPDSPAEVMLGSVRCTLRRLPLELVQKALVQAHLERVELLRTDRSMRDLQDRMRASDGRCAPVVFTYDPEDRKTPPCLFAGLESIAAAINIGLPNVSVLLVANGDAAAVQSYLIVKAREKPASAEEDFLMRVQSHHDD